MFIVQKHSTKQTFNIHSLCIIVYGFYFGKGAFRSLTFATCKRSIQLVWVYLRNPLDEGILLVVEFKSFKRNRKSKVGRLFQKPINHINEIPHKRLFEMPRSEDDVLLLYLPTVDQLVVQAIFHPDLLALGVKRTLPTASAWTQQNRRSQSVRIEILLLPVKGENRFASCESRLWKYLWAFIARCIVRSLLLRLLALFSLSLLHETSLLEVKFCSFLSYWKYYVKCYNFTGSRLLLKNSQPK